MNSIPISFKKDGLPFKGYFERIKGCIQPAFDLYLYNEYLGRLSLQQSGWEIDNMHLQKLAGYFGDYVNNYPHMIN